MIDCVPLEEIGSPGITGGDPVETVDARPAAPQARRGHGTHQDRQTESQRQVGQSLKVRQLCELERQFCSARTGENPITRLGRGVPRPASRPGWTLPRFTATLAADATTRSLIAEAVLLGSTVRNHESRTSARLGPLTGLVVAVAIFSGCPSDPHRRVLTGSGARRLRLARGLEEIGWLLLRTRRSRGRSLGQPSLDSGSRRRRLGRVIAPIAGPKGRDVRKERRDSDDLKVAAGEFAHGLALQKRPAPRIRGACLRYGASPWNSRR